MSKPMPKVIALLNHKGGVGKTTSAVNISSALFEKGKKVLLVDLDPQSNASHSLGVIEEDPALTIYGAMKAAGSGGRLIHLREVRGSGFAMIPSTLDLSGAEVELSGEPGREYILRDLLERAGKGFQYVIIDCPPSLGLLTLNALVASDIVLIPVQAHYLAAQGLTKIWEVVEKVRRRLNKKLKVGGVFITQYDARKVLSRDVAETIEENLKEFVFHTKIRDNIALAEAPARGLDIFRYDRKSKGAQDYENLTEEILSIT
jgi:chromosome partitioning protein